MPVAGEDRSDTDARRDDTASRRARSRSPGRERGRTVDEFIRDRESTSRAAAIESTLALASPTTAGRDIRELGGHANMASGVQSDSETLGDSVSNKVAGIHGPRGPTNCDSEMHDDLNESGQTGVRSHVPARNALLGGDAQAAQPPSPNDGQEASTTLMQAHGGNKDLAILFGAEDKWEAAVAWQQMFDSEASKTPEHSRTPADAEGAKPVKGIVVAPHIDDGAARSAVRATYIDGKAPIASAMPPPPEYAKVEAAKVWFVSERHGQLELLTYVRADSKPDMPQFDTFGGMAEPEDKKLPAQTAAREVGEEARVPSQWHQAMAKALVDFPLGHLEARVTMHGRKETHHVYLWRVDGCQDLGGKTRLTAQGQKEAKANSLAFRPAATVIDNITSRLPAYGKALQALLAQTAQANRACEGSTNGKQQAGADADATPWRPQADSIALRTIAHERQLTKGIVAKESPPNMSQLQSLAKGMGHQLLTDAYASKPALTIIPIPAAKPNEIRQLALCVPNFAGPLFEREIRLPVDEGFVWPQLERFAFYEDSGNLREAWAARGYKACSVADRPTQRAPSPGSYAFIGQVWDFVQVFPYPIDMHTSHVECGPASWSAWQTWPRKLLEGRMREAGEELIWISSIGNRSLNEQPHTAHETTIGMPTQISNANEHGGRDKTWCLWRRNVGHIDATEVVPVKDREEILSKAKGSKEQVMLQRSRTEPQMAAALVAAMDAYKNVPVKEPDRPAAMPCQEYEGWRRSFHHNLGILATFYAPSVADELIEDEERGPIAYIIPLAPGPQGPTFLVPLNTGSVFGIELTGSLGAKEEVEAASQFLSIGIESQFMHGMENATKDIVVAIPWDTTPVVVATKRHEVEAARAEGAPAIWATVDALEGTTAFEPVLYAAMRCEAMSGPVMSDPTRAGIWTHARPAILAKRAAEYGQRDADATAEQEWRIFLQEERKRTQVMQDDLLAADNGTGLVQSFRAEVRTAADYASELPVPAQGLPTFTDEACLMAWAPQRPPPLTRDWLHRLPPQAVPPGFVPLRYDQVLRGWARRMASKTLNDGMVYDAACFQHGETPPHLRRPSSITLGRGAAKEIRHADGTGTYNAFDILLELKEDGLYHPLDFTKPEKRVWVFKVIEEYLGTISNQEVLSFLFHGVCWKVNMRGQLHVSRNLARYDGRAKAVADTITKLSKSKFVDLVPICKVQDGLSKDGPSPFIYMPQNHVPIGGIDKEDGTARVVGDMTDPHVPTDGTERRRLRNKPEGEPDGPPAQSLNELSGPKGRPRPSYAGPLPFPEQEIKPRPKHKYAACVYLSAYAAANGTFLVTMDDDMRQMFFQFFIRDEDLYTCVWYIIMSIDGVLWLVAVRVRTMNMGGRNASKIACNFAEEWLDAWRLQMDDVVAVWLPKQKPAMQEAYERRKQELGLQQARPFWAAVYTDNFDCTFCASDLAAIGTMIWRHMNARAQIELQPKIIYGTCTTWIGGRYVLQGGFGCLPPSKRSRALQQCRAALAGEATREEYESNNSFLGHVADICGWPKGALHGITGPLMKPGYDDDIVVLTAQARERYENAIVLLESRSFASFDAGVNDAYGLWSGRGDALVPIRSHASDCCTEPMPHEFNADPKPHVAGHCNGYFWRFKLTGEWLDRHITLTESTGPALGVLTTVPLFPDDINVMDSDATAAIAAGTGRAKSASTQIMQRKLEKCKTYKLLADTLWYDHWAGWGNGITDLISRDNLPMAMRLAKAFGIKLTEVQLSAEALNFMREVLEGTRECTASNGPRESASPSTSVDSFELDVYDAGSDTDASGTDGGAFTDEASPGSAAPMEADESELSGASGSGTISVLEFGDEPVERKALRDRGGGLTDVESPPAPLVTREPPSPEEMELVELMSSQPLEECFSNSRPSPMGAPQPELSPRIASRPAPSPIEDSFSMSHRHSPRGGTKMLQEVASTEHSDPTRECGSPQPQSAADAISQANDHIAERLSGSTSVYAICPGDPSKLKHLVREACQHQLKAIPKGTKNANEWGFQKVKAFCKSMGSSVRWMRPRVSDPFIDVEEEKWFTCLALIYISHAMSPSARRAARGYEEAQPTSALLAIYGYHRVLRMCGRFTCDLTTVKQVLMGLCQRYKSIWGQEAFVKEQAKIFSKAMLLAVVAALIERTVPNWTIVQHKYWNVQFKYLTATGTRKDEVTREDLEDDCLMRENITLVDQSTFEAIEVTRENLLQVQNGHLIRGTSSSSKCDRLNVEWSKQRMWFRYDDTDPLCFAVAWVEWELACPCEPEMRRKWPAFSPTGNDIPASGEQAAAQHTVLLTHALGEAVAAGRTVHSHRARLASALAAARASGKHPELTDAVIQAHLRWKTLASLLSYAKATPNSFADNVALGVATDAGETIREDSPVVNPVEVVNEIIDTISVLSDSHKGKRKATEPEEPAVTSGRGSDKAAATTSGAGTTTWVKVVDARQPIQAHSRDTWKLVGTYINVPDELWNYEGDTTTRCMVSHFLGKYKFPNGGTHIAYTISPVEEPDANYAVRADYLCNRLSAATRNKLRKTKLQAEQ